MRKLLTVTVFLLGSLGLFGQNNFKYVLRANGGLQVGGSTLVKIDSITTAGGNIYFWSGGMLLSAVPGTGSASWGAISGSLANQIDLINAFNLKASLVSPTFTGTPVVPGYVPTSRMINGYDLSVNRTLNAADIGALGAGDTTLMLSKYARKYSPVFTGNPTVPGYVPTTTSVNGHILSSNVLVTAADASAVALADSAAMLSKYPRKLNAALTGVPTAPTAAPGTNTTQIATTEFATTADNLKLNVANPTATGTLTTPILKVGNAASNTITSIDSISHVTGATDINFFDGADTLNPYIPRTKRVDGATVFVSLADSVNYPKGYASLSKLKGTLTPRTTGTSDLGSTSLMYSNLFLKSTGVMNFDNGDVTFTHSANKILEEGGRLSVEYPAPAQPSILGYNSSGTSESMGVEGCAYYTGATSGVHYGGLFLATGSGANATNIGVYTAAANGGVYNIALRAEGNVNIKTGSLYFTVDTCLGTQTKNVLNKAILKVTNTCTLNGLSGGNTGQVLYIVNTSATTLTLKHNGSGTQKFFITGAADLAMTAQGNAVTCLFDGTNWYVVGKGY